MLAETTAFTLDGIEARPIRVEVDVQRGLPAFSIVGLPDAAVREARERIRSAVSNCGFEFPLRRITANLAPADLRKAGPALDLAMAAALLGASGELGVELLDGWAFIGELALDGSVRPVAGALAMCEAARASGRTGVVVPEANGAEAAVVDGLEVVAIDSLARLARLADGSWRPRRPRALALPDGGAAGPGAADLADLRGQPHLRMALEIAAAGGHSLKMIGPPGSGKTLAARRLPSILPALDREAMLEVARISSACLGPGAGPLPSRPFRAPHHTISATGLIGGGNPPRPGEATLAHRGVLFLDELCEFRRDALEALREPLESGRVTIVRARTRQVLPCRFTLVAAANPCPCGRGESDPGCRCSAAEVHRYSAKLSAALADRIDIVATVRQPRPEEMAGPPGEASAEVAARVAAARERAVERLGGGRANADARPGEVRRFELSDPARSLLAAAHESQGLSGRAHDRVLRLARTVADLAGSDRVESDHLAQALQVRRRPSP